MDSVFTIRNLPGYSKEPPKRELSIDLLYGYAHDIKESVRLYYEINNPHDGRFSDPEKIWLEKIRRIADAEGMMLVFAAYKTGAAPSVQVEFLEVLERVLFITTLMPYIPRFEVLNHSGVAVQLAKKKKALPDVAAALVQQVEQILQKGDLSYILREWGKRHGYRAKALRYFMFEYEQELKESSKTKRDKLSWDEFSKERFEDDYSTIEHVYPQKAYDDCWKTAFAGLKQGRRNVLRNSIGNLIPLSRPKNSSLSNRCFKEKKGSEGCSVGYMYGCYSENEIAQSDSWTAKEIFERNLKLLDFLGRRWKIPLGDRQKRTELLGLEFMVTSAGQPVSLDDPQGDLADPEETDA